MCKYRTVRLLQAFTSAHSRPVTQQPTAQCPPVRAYPALHWRCAIQEQESKDQPSGWLLSHSLPQPSQKSHENKAAQRSEPQRLFNKLRGDVLSPLCLLLPSELLGTSASQTSARSLLLQSPSGERWGI